MSDAENNMESLDGDKEGGLIPYSLLRFMEAFEAVAEPVLAVDLTGRIVFINEPFMGQFGYTLETANERGLDGIYVGPGHPSDILQMITRCPQYQGKLCVATKFGLERTESVLGTAIQDEGSITVGVLFIHELDVPPTSEDLKKEIEEKEELRSRLDEAKEICHDLNQPIQVLMGHSEMLLGTLQEGNPQHKSALLIKQQMDRMGGLMKQLRNVIRHEKQIKMIG